MSEMTDVDYGAEIPSRDDVLAQVRAHFARLREETEAMPDNATRKMLVTALDNTLRPVVEHLESSADHADVLHAAHTYLAMCQRTVIPKAASRRRGQLREEWAGTAAVVRSFETRVTPPRPAALAEAVRHLGRSLDTHTKATAKQLEDIACQLRDISTAFGPTGPAANAGASLLAVLADIDLTLTDSMELLVGSLPGKSAAVTAILSGSTSPPSSLPTTTAGAIGGAS